MPMRMLWIAGPLLLATFIVGCGSEPPKPVEMQQPEPSAQAQRAVSESAQESEPARPPSAPQSSPEPEAAESRPVEQAERKASTPNAHQAEDEDSAAESVAEETTADDGANSGETAQPATKDPTDVPATVVGDADVRARPGLVWRVIDRLSVGTEVVVLNRASGWFRIGYGEGAEGWIRAPALDLREVETQSILHGPPPTIIAEWRDEQYGVMGQSADAAEVRLLRTDGDQPEIISAPREEVTLLAEDITPEDLPILIGDETVVFPGDDFRPGRGRILPKANEWMWLPSGELLAHNDEYIWQWRPETDELEFVRRPPGYAGFSPGGESLAILTCGGEESCYPYLDVTILPLDGAPMVRLLDHAEVSQRLGGLKAIDILWSNDVWSHDFIWTSDGRGLLIPLVPEAAVLASAAALLHAERQIVILDPRSPSSGLPEHCRPAASPSGYGWRLGSNDLVAFRVDCENDAHELTWHLASYDASGQSIVVGPALDFAQRVSAEALPPAEVFDQLSDDAYELRGGTDRHSIVVDPAARKLFIYDQAELQLRAISDDPYGMPDWLWELLERGPGVGYQGWDLYWSENRYVVVISRTGIIHVAAGLLVDLTTSASRPLQIGSVRSWPCYPTGGWSPDGTVFQIEFEAFSSYERLEELWIDGLAASDSRIAQRQFVSADGETLGVLRALAHLNISAPSHLAGWSPDGDWLAIGGHQEPHHCY